MNRYKLLNIAWVFVLNIGTAQSFQQVKISNSIEMGNSMEEVWTKISNLENLDELVPEIIERTKAIGTGKGAVVILTLKSNGLNVVEKVTKLDNIRHIMAYEMLETPMPILDYKATIVISKLKQNRYKINFESVFKAQEKDRENMENTVNNFQKTLLANLKKIYSNEQ